jgi:hypothetical protein
MFQEILDDECFQLEGQIISLLVDHERTSSKNSAVQMHKPMADHVL